MAKERTAQSTIAVNCSSLEKLDKYLEGKGMSRKAFVENAIDYFIRNDFDLNDNVSILTPVQELIAEVKTHQEEQTRKQEEQSKMLYTFLQGLSGLCNLQNNIEQKALPEISTATQYKLAYTRAKKALQKLCDNNKYSVRISRIKFILGEYFDL